MKLQELHLIEAKKQYSTKDFPIMMDHLSDRDVDRLEKGLEKLNVALSEGELIATELKDIKFYLNRVFSEAYNKFIREKFFYGGGYQNIPDNLQFTGDFDPSAHRVAGILKKLDKVKDEDHKVVHRSLKFFKELRSVAAAMVSLKEMVVKKKKAAVQKAQAAESKKASLMSHADVKKIKDALTEVTQDIRTDVQEANQKWLESVVNSYKKQYDPENKESHYMYKFRRDPFSREVIGKVVEKDGKAIARNFKAKLKPKATEMTNDILDMFINKNTSKLAEIVKNKDNMKKITVVNAGAGRGVIEGLMKLTFKDGSQFDVTNKAVMSFSKYGKPFYRFPTTFHRVTLADGSKLRSPSEKKMKEEF